MANLIDIPMKEYRKYYQRLRKSLLKRDLIKSLFKLEYNNLTYLDLLPFFCALFAVAVVFDQKDLWIVVAKWHIHPIFFFFQKLKLAFPRSHTRFNWCCKKYSLNKVKLTSESSSLYTFYYTHVSVYFGWLVYMPACNDYVVHNYC